MKPARQFLAPSDRRRPASQDQKCRLKGVFRVVRAREHPAADPQDHGTVPIDQGRERVLGVIAVPA